MSMNSQGFTLLSELAHCYRVSIIWLSVGSPFSSPEVECRLRKNKLQIGLAMRDFLTRLSQRLITNREEVGKLLGSRRKLSSRSNG